MGSPLVLVGAAQFTSIVVMGVALLVGVLRVALVTAEGALAGATGDETKVGPVPTLLVALTLT